MVSNTDNHGLRLYSPGETDWSHKPDMETIETRLIIRDTDANTSNYTAHADALYFATDTYSLYEGDGTSWNLVNFDVSDLTAATLDVGSGAVSVGAGGDLSLENNLAFTTPGTNPLITHPGSSGSLTIQATDTSNDLLDLDVTGTVTTTDADLNLSSNDVNDVSATHYTPSSEPAAPTSGCVRWYDSTDDAYKIKFDDGAVVTIAEK